MKSNTILVRVAAVSALLGLQACDYQRASMEDHDPWSKYQLGTVYDCGSEGQPDMRLNTENTPSPGFGCSHNSNISAMVADPNDFKQSRELTPADAAARQRVVDAYRKGKDTAVAPRAKGTQELID